MRRKPSFWIRVFLIWVAVSLACSTLTSPLTDVVATSPPTMDLDYAKTHILDYLKTIQTLKWSGTGTDSNDGDFTVEGWDSPGRYYEIDKYDNGFMNEFILVGDTFCSRYNVEEWNCGESHTSTTLEILFNNVKGEPVFPDFSIVETNFSVKNYKGGQYYLFSQKGAQNSSDGSYSDSEYFDMKTFQPVYSVIKWVNPDSESTYEYKYDEINGVVDPIELPAQ